MLVNVDLIKRYNICPSTNFKTSFYFEYNVYYAVAAYYICILFAEWLHRQGGCLVRRRLLARFLENAVLIYSVQVVLGGREELPYKGGVKASQFDLWYPTPLSVTSCGRSHLGVAHWANTVALLQVIDN